MVAHTCKLDTISVVYISPIGNGSILLWLLLTYCAQWSFTSNGVWHFAKLNGADMLKNYFFPAFEVNFLKKLPQLLVLQMFQSSTINHGESLSHNILLNFYLTHIEPIFQSIIYITKKTPNLVAKILATKFGFVPDCSGPPL